MFASDSFNHMHGTPTACKREQDRYRSFILKTAPPSKPPHTQTSLSSPLACLSTFICFSTFRDHLSQPTMKVYKPGTDCEVDFTIFANGKPCTEFVFPDAADEPNAAICFIPVEDDAMITIQGNFTGSVLYSRIDVLADGAFVANRTIEDPLSKEGHLKFWQNRKLEVKTFLHVPDLNNRRTRREPDVVEGNLVAKRLSPQELVGPLNGDDDASSIGVGSITLIVTMNQQAEDTYGSRDEPAYPSISLGHWRDNIADVVDSGIKPEHEMAMDVFPKSNPVKDKRANQFRQMVKGVRFGSEPWVYIVFYYRSQAAIDAAGCVPLNGSKALQPDDGKFIKACDQVIPVKKVRQYASVFFKNYSTN